MTAEWYSGCFTSCNDIATIIISVLGAMFGAWLGAFITRRSMHEVRRKEEFNRAAVIFRSAFTNELRIVKESTVETDFIKVLNAAYVKHRNAVLQFLPYLSSDDRAAITKAWEDHCYSDGLDEDTRALETAKFFHYAHSQHVEFVNGKPHIKAEHEVIFKNVRSTVLQNIERILSFSEFK